MTTKETKFLESLNDYKPYYIGTQKEIEHLIKEYGLDRVQEAFKFIKEARILDCSYNEICGYCLVYHNRGLKNMEEAFVLCALYELDYTKSDINKIHNLGQIAFLVKQYTSSITSEAISIELDKNGHKNFSYDRIRKAANNMYWDLPNRIRNSNRNESNTDIEEKRNNFMREYNEKVRQENEMVESAIKFVAKVGIACAIGSLFF